MQLRVNVPNIKLFPIILDLPVDIRKISKSSRVGIVTTETTILLMYRFDLHSCQSRHLIDIIIQLVNAGQKFLVSNLIHIFIICLGLLYQLIAFNIGFYCVIFLILLCIHI